MTMDDRNPKNKNKKIEILGVAIGEGSGVVKLWAEAIFLKPPVGSRRGVLLGLEQGLRRKIRPTGLVLILELGRSLPRSRTVD